MPAEILEKLNQAIEGKGLDKYPIEISLNTAERGESLKGMQSVLEKFGDHKIGIEIECGECCKKVVNGAKLFFIYDFVVMLPGKDECLFLKIISDGKVVEKQILKAIIVPEKKLCAIEIGPVQIDP